MLDYKNTKGDKIINYFEFLRKLPFKLKTIRKLPLVKNYKILLYTGEGYNGINHLDLWLPIFEQSGINFLVVVRNKKIYNYISNKFLKTKIIYLRKNRHIKYLLKETKNLKACFYPSNTMKNFILLKKSNINHIFIGHGDSDKTASAHKFFRVYDQNWIAGEAHIDRFNNSGFNHKGLQHIIVGRPNLKEVLLKTKSNWKDRFNGKVKLLYLSTWEGMYKEQEYLSTELIKNFYNQFVQYKVIEKINIKLHPWIGKRKKELKNTNKEMENILIKNKLNYEIFPKQTPLEELIQISNVFICDISAVVSESLAGNGPIFVYIPKDKPIKILKSKMSFEDYTYVFSSIEELNKKFYEVVINKNDYLAKNRQRAMDYILGRKETLSDEFFKKLHSIEEQT